jgi:hypothetical protein
MRGMSRSASGALAASAALAATIASTAFLASAAGGSGPAQSTPAKHGVHLHTLAHFNQPTFAAGPPHSKHLLFVTERPGQIKVLHGDRKGGTFLDMRHWVSCCQVETGLFSIAFVFGFVVYESFESQDVAKSGHAQLPRAKEKQLGGHAVLAVGYDEANQWFIVRNSWGSSWGMRGYFTLPYPYLLQGSLSSDFWTIRSVE